MTDRPKLLVVIHARISGETGTARPALALPNELMEKSIASVERADDGEVFSAVEIFMPDETTDSDAQVRKLAIAYGEREPADWLCFLEPGEELVTGAFYSIAPAMQLYDGIWGGVGNSGADGKSVVPRVACYSGKSFLDLCHMTLHWWIGRSHFVRRTALQALIDQPGENQNHYGDYLIAMWRDHSCIKTASALTISDTVPSVETDVQQCILNHLAKHPRYIEFDHLTHHVKLAYTGRNPTLERVQMRGLFFEADELSKLADLVGTGATIVDIGANTGNHTVYFAKVMRARKVIAFEPNKMTAKILRHVIQANELENVDLSHLGKGVGARCMKSILETGRRGHLGTAQLIEELDGDIEIVPLDEVLSEPVDLIKIDVENMELDVLRGARRLIAKYNPVMLVEVVDENIMAFLSLIDDLNYRIVEIFPDHGYANYIVAPQQREEPV